MEAMTMEATLKEKQRMTRRSAAIPETGVLVDIRADGSPIVDYDGNELGPIAARTAIPSATRGDTVLLVFDHGDPTRPIIIGIVRDNFEKTLPRQLKIAAREILIEGAEEVSLRSGESSLTLRKDGKTVLKAKDVVSRASRTNRVKGATVRIN
jgi:hypothetical protein